MRDPLLEAGRDFPLVHHPPGPRQVVRQPRVLGAHEGGGHPGQVGGPVSPCLVHSHNHTILSKE